MSRTHDPVAALQARLAEAQLAAGRVFDSVVTGLRDAGERFQKAQYRARRTIALANAVQHERASRAAHGGRLAFASITSSSPQVEDLSESDEGLQLRATRGESQASVSGSALKAPPQSSEQAGELEQQGAPAKEARVLVTKVTFSGAEGLPAVAASAAATVAPNFRCSNSDVAASVRAISETGLFSVIKPVVTETRGGVWIDFQLTPNAPFKGYRVEGATALPQGLVDSIFDGKQGQIGSLYDHNAACQRIDDWYESAGYLAGVADDPTSLEESMRSGEFVFKVEELQVGEIRLRFVDADGNETQPKTKRELLERYIETKGDGRLFNNNDLQKDIQQLSELDVFDDVKVVPMPIASDSPDTAQMTDMEFRVVEKSKFRSFSMQGGMDLESGFSALQPIGTLSFSHKNLFGTLQRCSAQVSMHKASDRSIDIMWTDPWIRNCKRRVSQTVAAGIDRANEASIFGPALDEASTANNGSGNDSAAPTAGQSIRVEKWRASYERAAALTPNTYSTAGAALMKCRCINSEGETLLRDPYQWPLARASDGEDHVAKVYLSHILRHSNLAARCNVEQSIVPPVKRADSKWMLFSRGDGQVMMEAAVPFGTARAIGAAGAQFGDLPPYDARPLGGVNCVRGYEEGSVGTARHWGTVNLEYEGPRRPGSGGGFTGVAFLDGGTDFNSGMTVVGDPAGARGKPGRGWGYGLGVRMGSPMGPIRLEYAWSGKSKWGGSNGEPWVPAGRLHIGIGQRL